MTDTDALRQMVREALRTYPPRFRMKYPTAVDVDMHRVEGSFEALVRCIAFTLGGTYHAGYDRAAADAWRNMHGQVAATLAEHAAVLDANGHVRDEPNDEAALATLLALDHRHD